MLRKRDKVITVILMVVLGTCMHFVHELIPSSHIVPFFFPANETAWEHMKMIWFPFLAAGIIHSRKTGNLGHLASFVLCAVMAMMMQIGTFATYQSITGTSVLLLDIVIFSLSMAGCILLAFELAQKTWTQKAPALWIVLAVIITACIFYLTNHPGRGYVFLDDLDFQALIASA